MTLFEGIRRGGIATPETGSTHRVAVLVRTALVAVPLLTGLAGCISSSSPPPPSNTTVVTPAPNSTTVVCSNGSPPPCQ